MRASKFFVVFLLLVYPVLTSKFDGAATDDEACKICAAFAFDSLQALIDWIEAHKVYASCAELCAALNNTLEQYVCNGFCDTIGIAGFAALIKEVGRNPIYFCQLLKICPIQDCSGASCVRIANFSISPQTGRDAKLPRYVNFTLIVSSPVGSGIIHFNASSASSTSVSKDEFVPSYATGSWPMSMIIAGGTFTPGNYTVMLSACEGECSGSPHSAVLTTASSWLEVSKK